MTADGRNRWAACERAGVEPRTVEWDGEHGSPTRYAIAVNVQRRRLTASQKAVVAVEALPLLEDEAAKRKREKAAEAGKRGGRGNKREDDPGAGKGVRNRADTLSPAPAEPAQSKRDKHAASQDAAAVVGVSPRYVEEAKALANAERPDLLERVRQGELTLPQAKREVRRAEVVASLEAAVAALAGPRPADPLGLPLDERRCARLRELARRAAGRGDWQRVGRALWRAWRPSRRRA